MLFSKRLKSLRDAQNLSQKEFAALLEINPVTLSHYENEKREPDLKRLVALCSKLSVTADYLLGLSNSPSPTPEQPSIEEKRIDLFRGNPARDPLGDLYQPYREKAEAFIDFLRHQQEAEMQDENKEA